MITDRAGTMPSMKSSALRRVLARNSYAPAES